MKASQALKVTKEVSFDESLRVIYAKIGNRALLRSSYLILMQPLNEEIAKQLVLDGYTIKESYSFSTRITEYSILWDEPNA